LPWTGATSASIRQLTKADTDSEKAEAGAQVNEQFGRVDPDYQVAAP
jgi:hypothetical protein